MWSSVLSVAVAMTLAGACDGADAIDTERAVGAATYAAVIARFVPAPGAPEIVRVAYVAGVGDETLSLDDQVAVIDALADTHDVRFVDNPTAAYDPEIPGSPPRDDGVLIGVGKITGTSPHIVRVEVYAGADKVDAQLVTVSWHTDEWKIDEVEPVEPEVLIGDE